jgi:hypothetical protein
MNSEEPSYGPLQMLLVGFETTERFRGEIARELLDLRGRGMMPRDRRALPAPRAGRKGDRARSRPAARGPARGGRQPDRPALGVNGFGGNGGNGGMAPSEALARTAGFALEDLRS